MKSYWAAALVFLLSAGVPHAAPAGRNSHLPGDLARDRLAGMVSLLSSADKISLVRPHLPAAPLPPAHARAALVCLSDLVLDDALYTDPAAYDMGDKDMGEKSNDRETLTVGEFGQGVTISIWRSKPLLTITRFDGNRMVIADYLPVLPKVIRLIRAVDPADRGPDVFLRRPAPVAVKGVQASVLRRIATLKPGMTRADVLRLFTTEGGLSTTYWNHYVYRSSGPTVPGQPADMMPVPGGYVKVNVNYAPRDANILWLAGHGFWLHQNDYESQRKSTDRWGRPDDIVLRVSLPYIDLMVAD